MSSALPSGKKRKRSLDRRRGKTRIYEKLDFRNYSEVAGFLLDMKMVCVSVSEPHISGDTVGFVFGSQESSEVECRCH
uniref:Uncharacterized protein n=1 Tax=Geospiza parvula TaxID=87175 RepID=A0A8U8CAM5_GEOPR